jgi:hypothetical protein
VDAALEAERLLRNTAFLAKFPQYSAKDLFRRWPRLAMSLHPLEMLKHLLRFMRQRIIWRL